MALEAALDLPAQRQDENFLIEAGYAELTVEAYGQRLANYHAQRRAMARAAQALEGG